MPVKDPGYKNLHTRIKYHRGRASEYKCIVGEDHQARDWAHIHGTDKSVYDNYQPMCQRHHMEYDWTQERSDRQKEALRGNVNAVGRVVTEESRIRIREAALKREARKREGR